MDNVEDLVKRLQVTHWIKEIKLVEEIYNDLNKPTVRSLSAVVGRDKTWTGVSLQLALGIKIYPDLERCENRASALKLLLKRRKALKKLRSYKLEI